MYYYKKISKIIFNFKFIKTLSDNKRYITKNTILKNLKLMNHFQNNI